MLGPDAPAEIAHGHSHMADHSVCCNTALTPAYICDLIRGRTPRCTKLLTSCFHEDIIMTEGNM